jgi:hypothetical protein
MAAGGFLGYILSGLQLPLEILDGTVLLLQALGSRLTGGLLLSDILLQMVDFDLMFGNALIRLGDRLLRVDSSGGRSTRPRGCRNEQTPYENQRTALHYK